LQTIRGEGGQPDTKKFHAVVTNNLRSRASPRQRRGREIVVEQNKKEFPAPSIELVSEIKFTRHRIVFWAPEKSQMSGGHNEWGTIENCGKHPELLRTLQSDYDLRLSAPAKSDLPMSETDTFQNRRI
jgi:hypothetical protein